MLRRFESYGFAPTTTDAQVEELARVLKRTGIYIPEVLDSAVGHNRSSAGVGLVWEQAYASPSAYARYMCQPFHICVLDRYLLPESPECITAPQRGSSLGLFGYEIAGNPYRRDGGVRRVVMMKTEPDADPVTVDAFLSGLSARADAIPELAVSVAAANTMGLEWFSDGWTHVWEQAFDDEVAMARGTAGDAALLADGPMSEWAEVWYLMETDPDAPSSGNGGST